MEILELEESIIRYCEMWGVGCVRQDDVGWSYPRSIGETMGLRFKVRDGGGAWSWLYGENASV